MSSSNLSSRSTGSSSAFPGEEASEGDAQLLADGILPKFGDYELLSEIARGGMGIVYRARQKSLNRTVAVKLVLAGQLATRESLQRFRLEAEAAARLHHPGIVPIYEIGEHETQHFFSMELIDGASLAECLHEFVLDRRAQPAVRREQESCIAELMARVARALQFAHQHGVLHRDLKPSNILIDQNGLPHLTDFGLAKLTGRETSGLTLSHAVLGTPGYLAPEQAAGSLDVTTAADVYGLGATLYELLTGKPPFVGATALETMSLALQRDPVPPRQIHPGIHRDLETIALRCLEKRPEHRYRSAEAVAEELERFLRGEPIQARPISRSERFWKWCQRNPRSAMLAAALLLAILTGGGSAFWQWGRAEQANVTLREHVAHLEWGAVDDMLQSGQSARALARVAAMLREDRADWKAAMFGMSVMEQRRFPLPVAAPIRHPEGAELFVARLSPDGRRVATASLDGTARLWDAETSAQLLPPLRHEGPVKWAEFSPDGNWLATCSDDKTVRLWDVATGQPRWEPLLHGDLVSRVHFSADGRLLLTRTARSVSIYDSEEGTVRLGPLEHRGPVVSAAFIPGEPVFFTAQQAGKDSSVQAWHADSGEQLFSLTTEVPSSADVSSDLARVLTTSGRQAFVWDVRSGRKLQTLRSPNGNIRVGIFSRHAERIATIGVNHWARIWNTQSGLPLTGELPHYYLLEGLTFVNDGEQLLSWGLDALAQLWDSSTGEQHCVPLRHPYRVIHAEAGTRGAAALPDAGTGNAVNVILTVTSHGKDRAAGVGTGAAQLWSVHSLRRPQVRSPATEPDTFDGCRFSRDGKWCVVAMTTSDVWVLDTATGQVICGPLKVHGLAWGTMFTPDSKRLITVTSRGQVTVWNLPEGTPVAEPVQLSTTIQPSEITLDGEHFATGSTDNFVRLWSSRTGRLVWEQEHGSELNSVGFSPDGRWLASAGENRIVRIWERSSGRLLGELTGHQNEVMSVSYSPDSRRIVTAAQDFTGRIWDAVSFQQLHVLPHQGEVLDAIYSPDGRFVATGARDRTAMIWDAATGRPHVRRLLHAQGVRNVRFSPDSQRLLTLDFRGLRLWDVANGHPLTVHLDQPLQGGTGFQSNSGRPDFTPDGSQVLVTNDSPHSWLWQLPVPPSGAPDWFPEFMEAVAGERFAAGADVPEIVPATRFLELRQQVLDSPANDYYTRWARAWLSETSPPP